MLIIPKQFYAWPKEHCSTTFHFEIINPRSHVLRHDVVFLGIQTSEGQQCWSCSFSVIFEFLHPGDCFSKILKLFWSVMGPTIPFYSFTVPRSYKAIKLLNPLGFSYVRNMFKDQLFKTNGLQFDNRLLWPDRFSEFSGFNLGLESCSCS